MRGESRWENKRQGKREDEGRQELTMRGNEKIGDERWGNERLYERRRETKRWDKTGWK